jgi:predicted Ser/Thr protein kinase
MPRTGKDQHGSQADDSMVGIVILDQYKILRELARGGMGCVYLAEQAPMDRLAAIKIVQARDDTSMLDWRRRFRQEARTASRLVHPNIITVFNFGELGDGALFLAMEYVEGVGLGAVLQRGPLPIHRALEVAIQCVTALGYAHDSGVVHRDFKPDNVMLTEVGARDHVKILDFGVARIVGDATQTQAGTLLGTPRYMSPEQCRGEVATSLSDQYALGLVLYEMLTACPAIDADSPIAFLHHHQHQEPRPPSETTGRVELRPLDSIVLRMLAKDPSQRFVDMTLVLEALTAVAGEVEPEVGDGEAISPLCRIPTGTDEVATVDSGLPMALIATAIEAPKSGPSIVWSIGAEGVVGDVGAAKLERRGFHLSRQEVEDPIEQAGPESAEMWILGADKESWETTCSGWSQRGLPRERSLLCVNAAIESPGLAGVTGDFDNVLIGPWPADPTVVTAALQWLRCSETGGIEGLLSDRAVQVMQIVASSKKSFYVDALLEDARAEGFRQRVLRSLGELAEEMILNAVFHAPLDQAGERRYSDLDRAADVTLRPGEEPTLRWLILERFIALSIRDPFGSLVSKEVLHRVTGGEPHLELDSARAGAGMGLRIMSRAAKHLVFAILPGNWTEVLALVPRDSTESRSGGRSVCVLQGAKQAFQQLGDRLKVFADCQGGRTTYRLKGEINETSDLRPVFSTAGEVKLDLSQVTRINSVGLRVWVDAARLRPADQRMVFDRCSMAMVSQINMIPLLTEGVQVRSILAPYHCPHCDVEAMEVLTVRELERGVAPLRTCTTCRHPMQFDDIPEEYFAFVEAERGRRR